MPMPAIVSRGLALLVLFLAVAAAADPKPAGNPGEAEKAETVSKLEGEIEAATERKANAAKADDREKVKRLSADLKHLRLQLSKAKAKPPEKYVEEAAERARMKEEAAKLAAEKKQKEEEQKRLDRLLMKGENGEGDQNAGGKWYEGGTLHKKPVSTWAKASQRDKVATASDFVAQAWKAGLLKDFIANGIKTMDDMKPLAERLAGEVDAAYAKGQVAGGADVATAAASLMDRRWTKP